MERVGIQDAHAGGAVLRRAHPVQGAVLAYAWPANIEKAGASWARTHLPQWAPLIQQSSLWLSEGQYNEAGDEAGLQETVRFVHDVASRITGTVESASDASG